MPLGFRHWPHNLWPSLQALIPSSCALCGEAGGETLCAGCHTRFFSEYPSRCRQCAARLPTALEGVAALCGECLYRPPAFDATIVASDYEAPIDQLVLALKFGNRLALAPLFARMLHTTLQRSPETVLPTRLTAVPLGSQRLVERGFNQALEIAKPLSRALGVKLDAKLIARTRNTRAQAMLHPDERQQNIRRAFIVPDYAMDSVRGQHIGVIDDVITTGETLNEIAATLKRFGAVRVTNFVFARTLQK
jgi:ComF family protein